MSDIIYTPPASGGGQNPTTNRIPLNNGTSSFVDSNILNILNNYIWTQNVPGQLFGWVVNFISKNVIIGDFDNSNNSTQLLIDDDALQIKSSFAGNLVGIELNFDSKSYTIGDYQGNYNNTFLQIDDDAEQIVFNTQRLFFNGSNLISSTSGGNSGRHLVIVLNGATYKIQLLNP